jgi:Rrf2 family protein
MVLSKRSDYGMRILYELALEPDRHHSARVLADRHGVPEAFLRKILQDLRQAGVVVAQKGRTGGYRLALAPGEISVFKILSALEGPVPKLACIVGEECRLDHGCPTAPLWHYLERRIQEELSRLTLADVLRMGQEVTSP